VCPIAGLDAMEKQRSSSYRESNPCRLTSSPSLFRLSCPGPIFYIVYGGVALKAVPSEMIFLVPNVLISRNDSCLTPPEYLKTVLQLA
jgi:hypothetical protein